MKRSGKVKLFHESKGYGVIRQDSGGRDVRFRYADIDGDGFRTLHEGERVEYELAEDPRGLRAVRVRPVQRP
jgi:CspA family cold shock protein